MYQKNYVSDHLRNKIIALYYKDVSATDIAEMTGLTKIEVLDILQQNFAYKQMRGLA